MIKRFNVQLVDNWKSFHRFWSIRLGALGSIVTGVFIAWPDCLLQMFQSMPPDIRMLVHPKTLQYIGLFLFLMAMLSRVIKQRAVEQPHK